ncbi:putative retrotransposon hot spot protein 4 (RHS4) [Trypanosoma vivax]|nr:putative retrotransposon hot spot protein 4 (RHS4) [Trypanosoma vivax]
MTSIVVGTPGIGKSFGCGSFLLYKLLQYEGGLLDVVAYFVGGIAYVIRNARPVVPGCVVKYSEQSTAVAVIQEVSTLKKKASEDGIKGDLSLWILAKASNPSLRYTNRLLACCCSDVSR